jgi:hypothetical protein
MNQSSQIGCRYSNKKEYVDSKLKKRTEEEPKI